MQDFFNNELAVGDTVLTCFGNGWDPTRDIYEYCEIVRFTEKAVIVNRLKIKRKENKQKRVLARTLIKVDPAHYTMYILKKQKETV